jgi:hypothetical protein
MLRKKLDMSGYCRIVGLTGYLCPFLWRRKCEGFDGEAWWSYVHPGGKLPQTVYRRNVNPAPVLDPIGFDLVRRNGK